MNYAESARTVLKDLNILVERSKKDIATVGFSDRIDGMVEVHCSISREATGRIRQLDFSS